MTRRSTEPYSVYWIHRKDQKDPFTSGYIGVTHTFERRMASHKKKLEKSGTKNSQRPLYREMRKLGVEAFEFERLSFGLDRESAYALEFALRPAKGIGYNTAPGGAAFTGLRVSSLSPLRHQAVWRARMAAALELGLALRAHSGTAHGADECRAEPGSEQALAPESEPRPARVWDDDI